MILYTGGVFQGKLHSILSNENYSIDDVYDFSKINNPEYSNVDYKSKKVWYRIDEYIRSLALSGTDTLQIVKMIKGIVDSGKPEIIAISETGGGVIPMNKNDIAFREANGQIGVFLAENSDEVYRVICGLKTKIK